MDQVYLPKHRSGFRTGSYVLLQPIQTQKPAPRQPYFYHVRSLEPVKVGMLTQLFSIIDTVIETYENCLIVGSFLEKGFHFHDVDILLISEKKVDKELVQRKIEHTMGLHAHLLVMNNQTLIKGLMTDPLYNMMLSKCVARKRFLYTPKRQINYQLLDVHLLKSKTLIDNFDLLNGHEKYYLVRNIVAILLFLEHKKLSKDIVDKEIARLFALPSIQTITLNMLDKHAFLKTYKQLYQQTFNKIMDGIQHGAEQK